MHSMIGANQEPGINGFRFDSVTGFPEESDFPTLDRLTDYSLLTPRNASKKRLKRRDSSSSPLSRTYKGPSIEGR